MLRISKKFFSQSKNVFSTEFKLFATKAKAKVNENDYQRNDNHDLLISSKRKEFHFTLPKGGFDKLREKKFGEIPLASKGWKSNGSKSDYFIIHPTEDDQNALKDTKHVNELLDFGIDKEIIKNLEKNFNISNLTKVQEESVPIIMNSNHMLIAAETGCGKTLAYAVPIVSEVLKRRTQKRDLNCPLAVVITPGRELAEQIGNVFRKLSSDISVKTQLGGNVKSSMMNPEFEEIDVLVASLGALSKLTTTGIYRMEHVRHVVLDEADTLLDDSFSNKLCYFLRRFPFHKNHIQSDDVVGTQLILASATMPTNIEDSLHKIVDTETIHKNSSENLHKVMPHVKQKFLRINKSDRPVYLMHLVKQEVAKKRPVIVFGNTPKASDFVSLFLSNAGVSCVNLNGDMLRKIRAGQFEKFQSGEVLVLSTTDLGSRGLDTSIARNVINFDFPHHIADYIHRCGRVGRVSNRNNCTVTNFVSGKREIDMVQKIEHAVRTNGVLPNVDGNITSIIHKRIVNNFKKEGVDLEKENEPSIF